MIEALRDEIDRVEELLVEYQKIPQGAFGAIMLKQELAKANKALNEMDTVEMIKCLAALKECQ